MYCIAHRRVLPNLPEKERQQLLTQAHLHTLVEMLEAITDPRGKHGLRYDLPFLHTCLITALLCNCQSTEAVSRSGKATGSSRCNARVKRYAVSRG
jgi:hypothetical protein